MRRRVALVLVAVVLVATATLKLIGGGSAQGLLQFHPLLGTGVAFLELAIAGALIVPRTRQLGALAATVLLLLGGVYVALRPALALPPCGCLGGRVELGVGWHILLIGTTILLLADIAFPHSGRRA